MLLQWRCSGMLSDLSTDKTGLLWQPSCSSWWKAPTAWANTGLPSPCLLLVIMCVPHWIVNATQGELSSGTIPNACSSDFVVYASWTSFSTAATHTRALLPFLPLASRRVELADLDVMRRDVKQIRYHTCSQACEVAWSGGGSWPRRPSTDSWKGPQVLMGTGSHGTSITLMFAGKATLPGTCSPGGSCSVWKIIFLSKWWRS